MQAAELGPLNEREQAVVGEIARRWQPSCRKSTVTVSSGPTHTLVSVKPRSWTRVSCCHTNAVFRERLRELDATGALRLFEPEIRGRAVLSRHLTGHGVVVKLADPTRSSKHKGGWYYVPGLGDRPIAGPFGSMSQVAAHAQEHPRGDPEDMKCELAVLKGIIEHGDPGAYFGSFGGLDHWAERARALGWIAFEDAIWRAQVTDEGRRVYGTSRIGDLPSRLGSRHEHWDWSGVRL